MTDVEKKQPVDNSHRDAGIAARDAQPTPEIEKDPKPAAEATDTSDDRDDEQAETQNDPEGSATSDDGKDGQLPRRRRRASERIDELTREKHDAIRERDYWRQMAMREQAPDEPRQEPKPTQQAAPQAPDEPTLESCDFDQAKYQREWYEWRRTQEQREEQARKTEEAKRARIQTYAEKEAAFAAETPDYEQVAKAPHVPITQEMADLILEADNPPAIAYYLGKNLEEAASIAQMTPIAAARAIGRIEAKLSAPATVQTPPAAPKPVTRAPAPVTTLNGAPSVPRSYEGMSMKEYDEARKRERAAKGLTR